MLTVKNNNITIVKGQSCQFMYTGIAKSGKPFILPPSVDESGTPPDLRRDYAVLAFTVRTAPLGDIVIQKYFDLESYPMYDSVTDYARGGYRKFSTINIEPYIASKALEDARAGIFKVYDDNGVFVHILIDKNGNFVPTKYNFKLVLPIDYTDTADLDVKQYVYDLTIYYGELSSKELEAMYGGPENHDFPLKKVFVKETVLDIRQFNVRDSNNPADQMVNLHMIFG